jgi:unsaturated rhamnogalacturonyl hydrolase
MTGKWNEGQAMKSIRWSLVIGIFLLAIPSLPVLPRDRASDEFGVKSADVLAMMQKVADWQLAHPGPEPPLRWTQAALYTGMMALGDLSAETRYREAMMAVGRAGAWQTGERPYHADDYCVGQMYCEMYMLHRDPAMIAPLRERFDYILAHPSPGAVEVITKAEGIPGGVMRWWWCDALFMGPPAWARLYAATGEGKYLDFMIREWKATSDFLYDKDEHLYFRDQSYFSKREANGAKVFWSRGNGWVMGGLARVLQILPADHPERPYFQRQFLEMAEAALKCRQPDGLWHSSLLDPASYPLSESSGSGFFCYAMTWGINQGLLDRARFQPAVLQAWNSLVGLVNSDGKLTHVQPVGADPKNFDPNLSQTYGVGSFLLAGSEIHRMALLKELPHAEVQVASALNALRPEVTIELDWAALRRKLPGATEKNVGVMDGSAGRWLTTRILGRNGDGKPEKLLLQSDFLPHQKKTFVVFAGVDQTRLPAMAAVAARQRSPLKVKWR